MTAEYSVLAYVDYVIAANSQAADGSLIGEEQKNVCRAMYQLYQTVTGDTGAATCNHEILPYWISNGDGTDSFRCPMCFTMYSDAKVPASVTYYFTPYTFAATMVSSEGADICLPRSDHNIVKSFENTYARLSGKDGKTSQLLWQRAQADMYYSQKSGSQQQYSVDVGNAEYLVIKMRSTSANSIYVQVSTEEKSGNTVTATEQFLINEKIIAAEDGKAIVGEDGSYTYIRSDAYNVDGTLVKVGDLYRNATGYEDIILPAAADAADEEGFVTYVINLAEVAPEFYVKSGDSYKVDTLFLHFTNLAVDATVDFAYMAFVDGYEAVDALVDADTAASVYNDAGAYGVLDVENGKCVGECLSAEKKIGNTYKVYCPVCQTVKKTLDLSGISYFIATDIKNADVHYQLTPSDTSASVQFENAFSYTHYAGKGGTAQIIFNRSNSSGGMANASTIDIVNTEYVVWKMKASNNSLISAIRLATTKKGSPSNVYFKASTEWTTYVAPASLFANLKANSSGGMTLSDFYFNFADANAATHLTTSDYIEMSYIAFCDSKESMERVVDTSTAIFINEGGGAEVVGAFGKVDMATGRCVDEKHALTTDKSTGNYVIKCLNCDYVKEYDVSASDAKDLWTPDIIATKYYYPNTGVSKGASVTGNYDSVTVMTEDGVSFARLDNAHTNGSWHGWTMHNGWAQDTGRYMVMKVRMGENTFALQSMSMYIKTKASGKTWSEGVVSVRLVDDGEWHTIVVDLASRVANNAYATNSDGIYEMDYFQLRPYGAGSLCDKSDTDKVDIAYIAFCDDLSDVSNVVGESVYEISVDTGTSALVDTDTGKCVSHAYVYTTDETAANGYKMACGACGNVSAVNYVAYAGGVWQPNTRGKCTYVTDAETGLIYKHYESINSGAPHFDLLTINVAGGNGTYTDVNFASSRYMAIKYRTTATDISLSMGLSDKTNKHTSGNCENFSPKASIGTLPASENWNLILFDLSTVTGYQEDAMLKAVLHTNNVGLGKTLDVAWVAFADSPADFKEFAAEQGHKTYKLYKSTLSSTPVAGSFADNVSDNINWYSTLSGMNHMSGNGTKVVRDQYDEINDVFYNAFSSTGGTHINITGGSGAGTPTTDKYDTGRYIVIKYRGTHAGTLSLCVRTGDFGARANAGSQTTGMQPGDQWRVAVVDLSAVPSGRYAVSQDANVSDKTYGYTPDIESEIYVMLYPGSACALDVAYVAIVDDLVEARSLLRDGETYTYYGTSFANKGNEIDKNGNCITHAIPTAETVDGNTRSVVCLRSYDLETVNWFSPLSEMKCMSSSTYSLTTNLYDEDNCLFYNRYSGSGGGCHYLFTGGSGAGTWTTESYDTGNFVVIKYRAEADSAIGLNVSTEDHGVNPNATDRPLYSSVGALQLSDMAGVGADGWRVAVVAIPDGINYTKGSNQRIYFQMTSGSGNTTLDIAYCAVIDTLDEVKGLLGEGEGFYYYGTSLVNEPSKGDSNGNCLHTALTYKTVGTNYQIVCNACGIVSFDYKIDTSAAIRYRDDYQTGAYINYIDANKGEVLFYQFEENSPRFSRFLPGTSTNPFGGDTGYASTNSTTGKPNGQGAQYVVFKYRIGENNGLGQTMMDFQVKTPTHTNVEQNTFQIPVEEDGKWHTIVIDLAARVSNGNYDDNGGEGYCLTYIGFHPFGDKGTIVTETNPKAYVDIAYIASCDSLEDVTKLVGGDTYEWSVDNTTTEIRYIKDIICPDGCTSAVTYSETNGVRNYSVVCSKCGSTLMTDLNWYANGVDMGSYYHQPYNGSGASNEEEDGVSYKHHSLDFDGTNGRGAQVYVTGDNNQTTYSINTGKYLVFKMRGTASYATVLNAGTGASGKANAGESAKFTLDEWTIVVVDLTSSANYTAGTVDTVGIRLDPYNRAVLDIAYAAVVDSTDEVKTFIGAMGEGVDTFKLMSTWNFATAEDVAVDAE